MAPHAPQPCVFASKVQQLLAVVEASGFALQQDGKPVGGLAVSRPYLECALLAEGRRLEPAAAKAAASADLLFCSSPSSSGGLGVVGCAPCPLAPVEASSEDDNAGGSGASNNNTPLLPRDLGPALVKVLGPQAVAELKWQRVPSVALLARGAIPEAALAAAALAGVPVSPSLAGPHEEEVPTVVEVFLKAQQGQVAGGGGGIGGGNNGSGSSAANQQQQQRYPEQRLLLLRDGGFLALGADIDEAAAAFARAARARLLGDGAFAAVSEACGLQASSAAPSASGANIEAGQQHQQQQPQAPTLDAFDGLGSGALLLGGGGGGVTGAGGGNLGSHPLLMLGSAGGGAGNGHHLRHPSDTARAVPLFSLGGAATALRRLGHSLLGGRPTVGGRASDGAAEVISLGDTGGGAAGGNGGVARAGLAGALRPSLPGVRGLFGHGSAATGASPFALPSAGPPSSAGLPPMPGGGGLSNGGRKVSQGSMMMMMQGQGSSAAMMLPPSGSGLARKGSESVAPQRALPSFMSGGMKPW